MTTTTASEFTTTETPTPCPAWCQQHLADAEIEGTVHQRRVVVGDASLMIEQTTNAPEGCPDPSGPVVTEVDFHWISEGTIREYAQALNRAADLIGIPEVTA